MKLTAGQVSDYKEAALQDATVLERFAPLSASRGWRTGKYPDRLF